MAVTKEVATVYRGGGRRFFTLEAACRAEAFRDLKKRAGTRDWYVFQPDPHEYHGGRDVLAIPERWLGRGIRLLARWHKSAFKAAGRAALSQREGE